MLELKILSLDRDAGKELYMSAIAAASVFDCNGSVCYITDRAYIQALGDITLPALIVNGTYIRSDRVLNADEILFVLRSLIHEKTGSC